MTNAISLLRSKFFMLSCGIFTALSSVSVFAQEETGGLDDTILNNVNFDSIISDISAKIGPWVGAALGVAASIWVLGLAWRKIRSVMG